MYRWRWRTTKMGPLHWRLKFRFGHEVCLLARAGRWGPKPIPDLWVARPDGSNANVLVEFVDDGLRVVTSHYAIRKDRP